MVNLISSVRDEIQFSSDILKSEKKQNPTLIVKYLQICSANPHGIGVIPNLEMAKWRKIKAAQEKIKG